MTSCVGDFCGVGVAFVVCVEEGAAVQMAAAVVFGVRVIDQTRTPMPITAISPTATMARIPNFAGTRSGCGLLGAGPYGGTGP